MSDNKHTPSGWNWHRALLEHRAALFAGLTTVAISIGGIVEILPMYTLSAGPASMASVTPYTALEQAGRDIYVREGCYNCHSQMVRPFRSETLRYGPWSRAGEYEYEHPFQLGSRRIGPDLHRVGGKYPDAWHFEHMRDPRSTSPGSIMPPYAWLIEDKVDAEDIAASLSALAAVGVPYSDAEIAGVADSMQAQSGAIVKRLGDAGIQADPDTEIVALIAYLQRLGVDGRKSVASAEPAPSDDGLAAGGSQ